MGFPAELQDQPRPFSILVAALGGEGGAVLADWLVDAAARCHFPVQSTSIPGVSQRTGATTYYVEIFPVRNEELAGRLPVMALVPCAGAIDLVAASELVEAGRAMQNAFVTAQRTTLVASTHRIYATSEKTVPSDGRYASAKILAAAPQLAKRTVLFDMEQPAREAGTIINSVLFGAMAGSGALPLPREACEAAVRGAGKGTDASLRGFALGYARATEHAGRLPEAPRQPPAPAAPQCRRVVEGFPAALHDWLNLAVARLVDYQDAAYADQYLDRLQPVLAVDRELGGGADDFRLTRDTARLLALWMSYEDVMRVADLKTRAARFVRLRAEAGAQTGQPLAVVDYLKPGTDEIADILPPRLANWLRRWEEQRRRRGRPFSFGLRLRTSSVSGFLLLRLLALCKPLRRYSARFAAEQFEQERWLAAIERFGSASPDRELLQEIVQCAALLRGYGDTQRRGRKSFQEVFDGLLENAEFSAQGIAQLTLAMRKARNAALADPDAPHAHGAASDTPGRPVIWLKADSSNI